MMFPLCACCETPITPANGPGLLVRGPGLTDARQAVHLACWLAYGSSRRTAGSDAETAAGATPVAAGSARRLPPDRPGQHRVRRAALSAPDCAGRTLAAAGRAE